jgi:molecular chaperone GrpE
MSKKEKTNQNEPKAEGTPAAGTTPEPEPELMENPDTSRAFTDLEKELVKALTEAAEYKDGWQRSVADFQNYRRRVDAESKDTYQNAVGNIVKRYLPIIDDLERALAHRPADLAWADGIELIYRKLKTILEAEGLKRIEAEGQMFDPNFHEAILQEPVEGVECGTVIAVIQNGYMIGEKVIRPAQVKVAQ